MTCLLVYSIRFFTGKSWKHNFSSFQGLNLKSHGFGKSYGKTGYKRLTPDEERSIPAGCCTVE